MSDIGLKNSRENMEGSSFEYRTNFHRKNAKKKRPKAFKSVIQFSKK